MLKLTMVGSAKGGFIFHDLRHCFNTYMRRAGLVASVIMSITGHSTRTMFDRYNTIDGEDTRMPLSSWDYLRQNWQSHCKEGRTGMKNVNPNIVQVPVVACIFGHGVSDRT